MRKTHANKDASLCIFGKQDILARCVRRPWTGWGPRGGGRKAPIIEGADGWGLDRREVGIRKALWKTPGGLDFYSPFL